MIFTELFEGKDVCPVCGQTPCNCTSVKESQITEVDPRNFDSDVDYYAALNARPKTRSSLPRPRGDVDAYGNDWHEEEAFRANQRRYAAAKKKAEQDADHDRLATGTNEARVGNRMSDISIGSPKIVHYKGRAVGEVGIDHEASPGNGQYYMKHYLTGKDMVGYDTKKEALADLKYLVMQHEGLAEGSLNEFAPASNPGGGNYLKALASAWYNGTFNTGDLHKGIKSQEDVEKILARGIHCGDGKVRKYDIGYNSDFDGVLITSDDYYNYSDYDDAGNEVDERTGKPWGPYEYVEFDGNELDESIEQGVAEAPGAETLAHNQSTVASNEKAFDLEEGKPEKPEQPEADYGDDYQAMVARVKKLAGLGPLKTVYDPAKRVYRNVPTAVQPKK